ncbi:flavin containing amine oxidoreductase family protein [Mycobacterium kansasii 732]|nr:flavin containing amine oxidoreductase family protein [Mycobacterium kansasii 732]
MSELSGRPEDHQSFPLGSRDQPAIPGQFVAIQDLLDNHMNDVAGLYLAGEYLFPIACTEGALATGKKAAETVIDDLARAG